MSLFSVAMGFQTWSDYISAKDQITAINQSTTETSLHLTSLGHGLGAIIDGIDKLNADFNILMGDVIWKLELQNETLSSILATLQSPLDTASKELRRRAEYAYRNGWYKEALNDFIESERSNYQDFTVHRSIANIYLYHLINLPMALEYFRKAAKYARPVDTRQSAEAHYFAAIVCGVQQQFSEGIEYLEIAKLLNPKLFEAHYIHASFSAMLEDKNTSIKSLINASAGDKRYYERYKVDKMFDKIRGQAVDDQIMKTIRSTDAPDLRLARRLERSQKRTENNKKLVKQHSTEDKINVPRNQSGSCEVCGIKLSFLDKLFTINRCRTHR